MLKNYIKDKQLYYIHYTIFFTCIAVCIISVFVYYGKSFVWFKDGIAQHYPVLIYIHNYITGVIKNLLNGKLSIPMVDYRIGQGMDVITTLNYYGFGDPLMLLAVLCPVKYMEIMYGFLIFLRLYLSGIFFSMYCFETKQNKTANVLIGALLYIFSGYGLYASVRHPFFVNGMMFLPLVLIGVERAIKEKGYSFFAAVTGWSMLTNFYFTYMNTIIMAMYILFRFIPDNRTNLKAKAIEIFKLIGAYLCGILMSGIVAIPVIIAYLGCSRGGEGGYNGSLLHYDLQFYKKFIEAYFFTSGSIGEWTNLSFTFIAFIALLMLWFRKSKPIKFQKRNKLLKLAYIILTAMLLIPFAGKVMNGFGYVSNRWNYAYAMLIAYIVVCMLPDIIDLIMLLIFKFTNTIKTPRIKKKIGIVLNLIMAAVVLIQACTMYNNKLYISEFVDIGKVNDKLTDTAVQLVSDSNNANTTDTFYRTEQPWHIGNQSIAMNYFGHSWYFSIAPESYCKYYNQFKMNTMDRTYSFRGLDSRTMLNELASTKYYVSEELDNGLVPFGYTLESSMKREDGAVQYLYKNDYFLPIGYTVDKWISSEEYSSLSCIEKQEALMQSVVLDSEVGSKLKTSSVPASELTLKSVETKCRIKAISGAALNKGKLDVTKDNAFIDIEFSSPKNCETYLYIKGMNVIESKKSYQTCIVRSETTTNSFVLMSPKKTSWYYNPDITINLGYSSKKRTNCRITIPYKGKYTLKNISIVSQPMNNYKAQVKMLSENTLKNLKIDTNTIDGDISLEQTKIMQFSIPYSLGWKAYIDGKETELINSNDMYMALEIPSGNHHITLKYKTNGIVLGTFASGLGFAIFVVYNITHKRRKNGLREKKKSTTTHLKVRGLQKPLVD